MNILAGTLLSRPQILGRLLKVALIHWLPLQPFSQLLIIKRFSSFFTLCTSLCYFSFYPFAFFAFPPPRKGFKITYIKINRFDF